MSENTFASCTGYTKINETVNINDSLRLTDNMPSIKKLLYTDNNAVITETITENANITIKGEAYIKIYYEAENSKPEAVSGIFPFNYIIECPNDSAVSVLKSEITYCETDSSKQRRFDINMKINISGYSLETQNISCEATLPDKISYIKKTSPYTLTNLTNTYSEKIYEYTLPCDNIIPYKIVSASCFINDENIASSRGGVMYSATVKIETLCISEGEDGEYVYNACSDNFAVNEFINTKIEEVYQNFALTSQINVLETYIIKDDNSYGIGVRIKALYRLDMIQNVTKELIDDIYSVEKKVDLKRNNQALISLKSEDGEVIHIKDSPKINFPKQINRAVCPSYKVKITERNKTEIKGEVIINTIILNSPDGKYSAQNCVIPFGKTLKKASGEHFERISIRNFTIDTVSDRLMIEADICIENLGIEINEISQISEVNLSEYENESDNFTKIKIHYYNKNESLWNIAKNNRTSVEEIMKNNEIKDEKQIPQRYPLIIR